MQPTQFADAALAERFWAKVDSRSPHECWEWQAGRHSRGYGIFYLTGHTQILAHRLALALATGTTPEGAYALHSCDNPPCCNPEHLRLGTHSDNMRDRSARGRAPKTVAQNRNVDDVTASAIRAAYQPSVGNKPNPNGYAGLGRRYNLAPQAIKQIVQGKTYHTTLKDYQ